MNISKVKTRDFTKLIELLQETMRPKDWNISIDHEYPLLFQDQSTEFSYAVYDHDRLIAHLNYFPRLICDASGKVIGKIALIANVASSPEYRKQGLIKKLFSHLEEKAEQENIDAFILWSDLAPFYQKLDYRSLGKEWLYEFQKQDYPRKFDDSLEIEILSEAILEEPVLSEILALRPTTPYSLKRNAEEFKRLLQIPYCTLALGKHKGQIRSYCVLGKGMDMLGVIHEWGADSTESLDFCIHELIGRFHPESIRLLSPYFIEKKWLELFDSYASNRQLMDMAWCKIFEWSRIEKKALEECFIWGLDSI